MTKYDPEEHHRRSIRLKGYDYSLTGAYFVTICVQDGQCFLGEITKEEMVLNPPGAMVQERWLALQQRFPNIELDAMVIMPNHIHGILVITVEVVVGDGLVPPRKRQPAERSTAAQNTGLRVAPTIGEIVGAFKSVTTNQYIHGVHEKDWAPFKRRLWQRNYWERIIRNPRELG